MRTALEEALNELIATQEGGREQALSKLDAVVRTMVNQALRGRKTDLSSWLRLAGLFEVTPKPTIATPVTANDADIIDEFFRRHWPSTSGEQSIDRDKRRK